MSFFSATIKDVYYNFYASDVSIYTFFIVNQILFVLNYWKLWFVVSYRVKLQPFLALTSSTTFVTYLPSELLNSRGPKRYTSVDLKFVFCINEKINYLQTKNYSHHNDNTFNNVRLSPVLFSRRTYLPWARKYSVVLYY